MEEEVNNFIVLIEQGEDGWFIAKAPDIPGCMTQGKSVAEVLERIKEAIELCLEADTDDIHPLKFVGVQQIAVAR